MGPTLEPPEEPIGPPLDLGPLAWGALGDASPLCSAPVCGDSLGHSPVCAGLRGEEVLWDADGQLESHRGLGSTGAVWKLPQGLLPRAPLICSMSLRARGSAG